MSLSKDVVEHGFLPPNTTLSYQTFKTLGFKPSNPVISPLLFRTAPFPFDNLPGPIHDVLENALAFNPGITQVYLDDHDCREFLLDYFPTYVMLYDNLIPGAYKADLVRLCLLYTYGGVYNDIGHRYVASFLPIINDIDLVLTNEPLYNRPGVYNAWMACIAYHPMIKKFMEHIIHNLIICNSGDTNLDVTGPRALGKCLGLHYDYLPSEGNECELGGFKLRVMYLIPSDPLYITYNGETLLYTKFNGYHDVMYPKKNYYYNHWFDSDVYKFPYIYPFSIHIPTAKVMFRMSPYPLSELPDEFKGILYETKIIQPDWMQVYLDDADCLTFLTHWYPDYVPLWKSLAPGAYKSDLVRLCLLHKYGGVYNDIHHRYGVEFGEFLNENASLVLVKEEEYIPLGIHNSFLMSARPGHPLIHAMMLQVADNIRNQLYGESSSDITGSIALAKSLEKSHNVKIGHHLMDYLYRIDGHMVQLIHIKSDGYIYNDDTKIICTQKSPNYLKVMYEDRNVLDHHDLWHSKQVYQ